MGQIITTNPLEVATVVLASVTLGMVIGFALVVYSATKKG
jgi:hypothetical protein